MWQLLYRQRNSLEHNLDEGRQTEMKAGGGGEKSRQSKAEANTSFKALFFSGSPSCVMR